MNRSVVSVSRRHLFAKLACFAPALPLLGSAAEALAQAAKAAASCQQVAATDPVASGLKYVPDGSKVADRPAKMGVEAKAQSCSTCQLYTKTTDEAGKCVMIQSGCVAAKGWCTAWVKKA